MIKADNLIYEYENNKKALYGVDLDIKPGEFISIVEIGRASCRERV